MSTLPPILILTDLSALMAGNTQEWQEYSRVGSCLIPKIVLDEMQSMATRGAEPAIEQIAREFGRFYPKSGWKHTDVRALHASLKPAPGHTMSKQARLSLAVAECAYGLAQTHDRSLVVLVANNPSLLQRVRALEHRNLCAIPLAALMQWSRSHRRPGIVTQQLQAMGPAAVGYTATTSAKVRPRPAVPAPTPIQSSPPREQRLIRPVRTRPGAGSQTISGLLALSTSVILGLFAWSVLQPTQFQRFWQQMNLPPLPGQPYRPAP